MLSRFSNWLNRVSTTPVVLLALAVFVIFTILVLPAQTRDSAEYTGDNRPPDLSFFYSPQYLYDLADSYGESGRQEYVHARFTFDIAWPIVYTFFLVTTISWLFTHIFPPGSRWRMANLAPVFAAILDLLENTSTSIVMLNFPYPSPVAASLAPIFTMAKWILVMVSFILLLYGIVAFILVWIRERKRPVA